MLSAYADEAARLVLEGYDVERILALTRWALSARGSRCALRAVASTSRCCAGGATCGC